MKSKKLRQLSLIILMTYIPQAFSAGTCTETTTTTTSITPGTPSIPPTPAGSSTGSVLAVWDPAGLIDLSNSSPCRFLFSNTNTIITKNAIMPTPDCLSDTLSPIIKSNTVAPKLPMRNKDSLGYSSNYSVYVRTASQAQIGNESALQWWNNWSYPDSVTIAGNTIKTKNNGTGFNTFIIPSGRYKNIKIEGTSMNLLLEPSSDNYIESLECASTEGNIIFSGGDYFIGNLNIQARCNLVYNPDDNSGIPVRLFLDNSNKFEINSNTCINYQNKIVPGYIEKCDATNPTVNTGLFSTRLAEKMQIFVRNGEIVVHDSTRTAALLYSDTDRAEIYNGTPVAIVGSVVAKNISAQNNSMSYFMYKGIGAGGSSGSPATPGTTTTVTTTVPAQREGYYSLARPAIPIKAVAGNIMYMPAQRDQDTAGNPGTSGHLRAFSLLANGLTPASPVWDAADNMNISDRKNRFYTNSPRTNLPKLLNTLSTADLSGADYFNSSSAPTLLATLFDPNYNSGALLAGRNPNALVGAPYRTSPVIAGTTVVFAADDGVLYGVNSVDGDLKWGYIPRPLLLEMNNPKNLMDSHPWGQLTSLKLNNISYVMGTVMHGKMRFSLKLTNTGYLQTSGSIFSWVDYDPSAAAPEVLSSTINAGGAAPAISVDNPSRVGYIKLLANGTRVFVARNVDGSTLAPGTVTTPLTSSGTPTSNPIYLNDSEFYYGDALGKIYQAGSSIAINDLGVTDPVLSLTGTYMEGPTGQAELFLLANTKTRVAAFKRSGVTWSRAWYTDLTSSSTPSVPHVSPSDVVISGPPTIISAAVIVPVTHYGDPNSVCDDKGYLFGGLNIVTGEPLDALDLGIVGGWNANRYIEIGEGESLGSRLSNIGSSRFMLSYSGTNETGTKQGEKSIGLPRLEDKPQNGWRELTTFRK